MLGQEFYFDDEDFPIWKISFEDPEFYKEGTSSMEFQVFLFPGGALFSLLYMLQFDNGAMFNLNFTFDLNDEANQTYLSRIAELKQIEISFADASNEQCFARNIAFQGDHFQRAVQTGLDHYNSLEQPDGDATCEIFAQIIEPYMESENYAAAWEEADAYCREHCAFAYEEEQFNEEPEEVGTDRKISKPPLFKSIALFLLLLICVLGLFGGGIYFGLDLYEKGYTVLGQVLLFGGILFGLGAAWYAIYYKAELALNLALSIFGLRTARVLVGFCFILGSLWVGGSYTHFLFTSNWEYSSRFLKDTMRIFLIALGGTCTGILLLMYEPLEIEEE
ncbi:hypothetical protein ACFL35_05670 [Candidatus Riflebacteria bacterium]